MDFDDFVKYNLHTLEDTQGRVAFLLLNGRFDSRNGVTDYYGFHK